MTSDQLINTGHLDIVGVDVMARAEVTPHVGVDAAYSFIKASGSTAEPLDFLPHHHYEASLRGTWGDFSGYARVRTITQFIDGGVTMPGYTLVEGALNDQLSRTTSRCCASTTRSIRARSCAPVIIGIGRVVSLILQGTWN